MTESCFSYWIVDREIVLTRLICRFSVIEMLVIFIGLSKRHQPLRPIRTPSPRLETPDR